MRLVVTALALLAAATVASGQDFTWAGWAGPANEAAWGAYWTWDNEHFHNGWGYNWNWDQDPAAFFPQAGSAVSIPGGAVVDVGGNMTPACGNLSVAPTGVLRLPFATLAIHGPTLMNDGEIRLTSYAGNLGTLEVGGPLSIAGAGTIEMAAGCFQSASPLVLTVGPLQTIRGAGRIGWVPSGVYHGAWLTNHGRIQASNPAEPLEIFGVEVVNDGSIEATSGATLRLWGDWDNAGGVIRADDGGIVWLGGEVAHPARITGGHLRTSGGGEIQPDAYSVVADLTNEGRFHVRRYAEAHLAGTIVNDGLIDVGTEGSFGYATVHVDNALTFGGHGVLRLGAGNALQMRPWPAGNARVTNGPDHVVEALGGQFGQNPDGYGDRRIEVVNEGRFVCRDAVYGCRFYLAGAGFVNRGELSLEPAANVDAELWGGFHQTAGRLDCDDALIVHDGPCAFTGGVLAGHGYLQGTVTLGGGAAIHPGGTREAGTLTVGGPLTFAGGATLACDWSLAGTDQLVVHGRVTTAGSDTVRVAYLGSGFARTGDYVVLTCDEVDDHAAWTLVLPDGWGSAGLAWVGTQLVVRGLTGMPTAVPEAPAALALRGAFPNPCNPRTTVRFAVDRAGPVRLWLADLAGHRVRTLVDEARPAGDQSVVWDGRDDAGRSLGSGAYVCVLEGAGRRQTARVMLVR